MADGKRDDNGTVMGAVMRSRPCEDLSGWAREQPAASNVLDIDQDGNIENLIKIDE